ncbi:hypothetical protein [Streptomyces hebeiensis]|uniref:hypothetical protein n=1 Tax=Streptomyces hebeiensis TaxID=229486 RepID=UPI0031D2A1EA
MYPAHRPAHDRTAGLVHSLAFIGQPLGDGIQNRPVLPVEIRTGQLPVQQPGNRDVRGTRMGLKGRETGRDQMLGLGRQPAQVVAGPPDVSLSLSDPAAGLIVRAGKAPPGGITSTHRQSERGAGHRHGHTSRSGHCEGVYQHQQS